MQKLKKIIILGSGTSGLMAALLAKKKFPEKVIEIISSEKIGILGVGEGTTEHWSYFCEIMGEPIEQSIIEADATLKFGICFKNWGVPDYYHSTSISLNSLTFGDYHAGYARCIMNNLQFIHPALEKNLIPSDWCSLDESLPVSQFHFNTFKLNDYLVRLCQKYQILITDDKIKDITIAENGEIKNLIGTKTHTADFFIDASGFSRILMTKLKAKWISYKKNLWTNSAIAFQTEDTDEYPCFTQSVGLDYGWMWNAPVQHRWGNGYVFCDEYIDFEQAQQEVEKKLEKNISVAKKIKFEAGQLDKSWIKNCVSIGIATSFIEPLESSTISQSFLQTILFLNLLPSWKVDPVNISELYNKKVEKICLDILDFVSVHYLVPKDSSKFWLDLKHNRKNWMTNSLNERLSVWKNRLPLVLDFSNEYTLFTADNWIQTLHGIGLINYDLLELEFNEIPLVVIKEIDKIIQQEKLNFPTISHKKGLDIFKKNWLKKYEI